MLQAAHTSQTAGFPIEYECVERRGVQGKLAAVLLRRHEGSRKGSHMGIMRTKSVEQSIRDTEEPEFQLRKALGPLDLTVFGIGVIIGTGLFVLTGKAAASFAGPAISLSYILAGVGCAFAALCYAEFASTVPVAGSASKASSEYSSRRPSPAKGL